MSRRIVAVSGSILVGVLLLFGGALAFEFDGKWPSGNEPEIEPLTATDLMGSIELGQIELLPSDFYVNDIAELQLPDSELLERHTQFVERSLAIHCAVVEGIRLPPDYGMSSPAEDAYVDAQVQRRIDEELTKLPPDATRQQRIGSLWGDRWPWEVSFDLQQCQLPEVEVDRSTAP